MFLMMPGYTFAPMSVVILDFLQGKRIKPLVLTVPSTPGCVIRTAILTTDVDHVATIISDACAALARVSMV